MFSMMRGLANVVAPILVGTAIDVIRQYRHGGSQYAVIWLYTGVMIAVSLVFFRKTARGQAI
jgi:hypothetical protein